MIPVPDPDPSMPSDLIVALELAHLSGWLEHASINAEKKKRICATLMDGAQRLAFACLAAESDA